jgi:hypothetical protein
VGLVFDVSFCCSWFRLRCESTNLRQNLVWEWHYAAQPPVKVHWRATRNSQPDIFHHLAGVHLDNEDLFHLRRKFCDAG